MIVDYGMGNLGSIANMLKRIGATATISSNADEIIRANKLILPGIGAFDAGMRELRVRGLDSLLTKRVEGVHPGLGWLDAETIRFALSETSGLKIPHMGWNCVRPAKESLLLQDWGDAPRFFLCIPITSLATMRPMHCSPHTMAASSLQLSKKTISSACNFILRKATSLEWDSSATLSRPANA